MIIDLFYKEYRKSANDMGIKSDCILTFDDLAKEIFKDEYNKMSKEVLNKLRHETIANIINKQKT